MQRYIKFARSIKPEMSPEAHTRLIDEYCNLRSSDQGRGKTAWRITVRQLESLIRLSEALARLHLESIISKEFVQEAARLLRQSIVNIQMEDVELLEPPPLSATVGTLLHHDADDEERPMRPRPGSDADDDLAQRALKRAKTSELDSLPSHPGSLPADTRMPEESLEATVPMDTLPMDVDKPPSEFSLPRAGSSNVPKKPARRTTKITRDMFDRLTRVLLMILRTQEEDSPDNPGVRQKDLVAKYLDVVADEFNSEEAIKERRDICRAALEKLITQDKLLQVLPSAVRLSKEERIIVADADRSAQILGDDL